MNLKVWAPGATEEQRRLGVAAALSILQAKGLAPEAAATAWPLNVDDPDVTPARARAAAIWQQAISAASAACTGFGQEPRRVELLVTESTTPEKVAHEKRGQTPTGAAD